MLPHRVGYWNIGDEHYLIFPIAILAIAVLFYAFRQHYRMWRLGRAEKRFDRPGDRLKGLLSYGFGNARVVGEGYPGLMHVLIYGGMVLLFIGTVMDSAEYYLHLVFNVSYLQGTLYLVYSLVLDIAAAAVVVGLLLAAYRRYIQKPDRLNNVSDDWISLALLAAIVVSGLLVEGFRIAVDEAAQHPDWSVWSPLGYGLALTFNGSGLAENTQLVLHRVFWWVHMLGAMGWIAYIFHSKLSHICVAPLNIYLRNLQPTGTLPLIPDMENAETFGAGTIRDFTWKQLLDLDACVRCGRCQDNCPAYLTGKPLSPKALIQDLKMQMEAAAARGLGPSPEGDGPATEGPSIIGDAITDEIPWACTTCGACQEVCPVFVEHINKVVDIRRNLVLMESRMPEGFQTVLTNLERRGHPWAGTQYNRTDWINELGLKALEPEEEADLLYWVGCTGVLEGRSRKITYATARLLRSAGVSFGLLGSEEACCGDAARRIGNEYLFQMMAQQNVEVLKSHGVKRIVTHCPHCFNVLKNEYPQLGGEFQVVHHSQLLAQLVQEGKLRLNKAFAASVAVHDSCYLGRHNHIYDAPREILKAVPGVSLSEMKRSKERSFCCGGGGGHMWVEETTAQRINDVRVQQALETGADVVAVACPYCLQMFEAGIKAKDQGRLKVRDLSEIIEEVVEPSAERVTTPVS